VQNVVLILEFADPRTLLSTVEIAQAWRNHPA